MSQSSERATLTRPAVAGRIRGAVVGAAFGAGWAAYGLSQAPLWAKACGGAVAVIVIILLLGEARVLLRRSGDLPAPDASGLATRRRAAVGFAAVLIGEIVLLNVAVNLLSAPDLRHYWISAISLVVGGHFLPLAWLFRMKAFWACGAAMMIAAVAASLVISQAPAVAGFAVSIESLANAVILWLTAAAGLASLRARLEPGA